MPFRKCVCYVKKLFVDTKIMQEPFFEELLNLTHNNQGKAVVSDNVEWSLWAGSRIMFELLPEQTQYQLQSHRHNVMPSFPTQISRWYLKHNQA